MEEKEKQLNKEEIEKELRGGLYSLFDKVVINYRAVDRGDIQPMDRDRMCADLAGSFIENGILPTIEKVIDDLVGEEEEYLGPEEKYDVDNIKIRARKIQRKEILNKAKEKGYKK